MPEPAELTSLLMAGGGVSGNKWACDMSGSKCSEDDKAREGDRKRTAGVPNAVAVQANQEVLPILGVSRDEKEVRRKPCSYLGKECPRQKRNNECRFSGGTISAVFREQ